MATARLSYKRRRRVERNRGRQVGPPPQPSVCDVPAFPPSTETRRSWSVLRQLEYPMAPFRPRHPRWAIGAAPPLGLPGLLVVPPGSLWRGGRPALGSTEPSTKGTSATLASHSCPRGDRTHPHNSPERPSGKGISRDASARSPKSARTIASSKMVCCYKISRQPQRLH